MHPHGCVPVQGVAPKVVGVQLFGSASIANGGLGLAETAAPVALISSVFWLIQRFSSASSHGQNVVDSGSAPDVQISTDLTRTESRKERN